MLQVFFNGGYPINHPKPMHFSKWNRACPAGASQTGLSPPPPKADGSSWLGVQLVAHTIYLIRYVPIYCHECLRSGDNNTLPISENLSALILKDSLRPSSSKNQTKTLWPSNFTASTKGT